MRLDLEEIFAAQVLHEFGARAAFFEIGDMDRVHIQGDGQGLDDTGVINAEREVGGRKQTVVSLGGHRASPLDVVGE